MKTTTKVLIVMIVITVALVLIFSDTIENISNFKILAWGMVFVTAVTSNFMARQWFYSRKAAFYADAESDNNEGNGAISLAPGPDNVEEGYYWAYPGVSAYVSTSSPYKSVIVSLKYMVYPGRNVLFKGEKVRVSSEQLLSYLQGNKILYQKIMNNLVSGGKIYIILKLPWYVEKACYSKKGGYPINTDKFIPVMKIHYRHVLGNEYLSKAMETTFGDSLKFSQDTMQTFRRISEDVNASRKTGVPQPAERPPIQPGNEKI